MTKRVTAFTETGSIALVVHSVRREGNKLVVAGKAMGTMGMDFVFPVQEIFNIFRMSACWSVISLILLLPYFGVTYILKHWTRR